MRKSGGGWCAYAIAKNQKAPINPETFEIRDGQLLLFPDFLILTPKLEKLTDGFLFIG